MTRRDSDPTAMLGGALLVLAVVFALAIGWVVLRAFHALASDNRARYSQVSGPGYFPERVVIRCEHGWAEDTAAHLRLVVFEPDRVVFRCRADF